MLYILLSILVMILTVIIHAIIWKLPGNKDLNQKASYSVFPAGGILELFMLWYLKSPYIITMLMFYAGINSFYLIYFFSTKTGEESPSSKIISAVKASIAGGLSKNDILKLFSDEELITDRLMMLKMSGFIKNRKKVFFATNKGGKVAAIVELYRILLGWNIGG